MIVEERRWLTDADYAAMLGMGQVLPGPNTVNAAVMIGDRFQGPVGACLGLLGMMAMPLAILIALASVDGQVAGVPAVQRRWPVRGGGWWRAGRYGMDTGGPRRAGADRARSDPGEQRCDRARGGPHALASLITGATTGFVLVSGRNPLWTLGEATAAGMVGWLFGCSPDQLVRRAFC